MTCAVAPRVDYHPCHDPHFGRDIARDLLHHVGEWRHPGREVLEMRGGTCDSAELAIATWRAIESLRRVGLVIEGDPGRYGLGYRLTDIDPPRYLHLHETDDEPRGEVEGQLSITAG